MFGARSYEMPTVSAKISVRWIPRLSLVERKQNRLTISCNCLKLFEADPEVLLDRFVTMDETLVHHYISE